MIIRFGILTVAVMAVAVMAMAKDVRTGPQTIGNSTSYIRCSGAPAEKASKPGKMEAHDAFVKIRNVTTDTTKGVKTAGVVPAGGVLSLELTRWAVGNPGDEWECISGQSSGAGDPGGLKLKTTGSNLDSTRNTQSVVSASSK